MRTENKDQGRWKEGLIAQNLRIQGKTQSVIDLNFLLIGCICFWGFYNKLSQMEWLKTMGMCCLMVLDVRSLKLRMWAPKRENRGHISSKTHREILPCFFLTSESFLAILGFLLLVSASLQSNLPSSHGSLPMCVCLCIFLWLSSFKKNCVCVCMYTQDNWGGGRHPFWPITYQLFWSKDYFFSNGTTCSIL